MRALVLVSVAALGLTGAQAQDWAAAPPVMPAPAPGWGPGEVAYAPAPPPVLLEGSEARLRFQDRKTGATGILDVPVGRSARYGDLRVTVKRCMAHTAAARHPEAGAYLTIEEGERRLFGGWMLASSPGLNALDHPRYDVWVAACRTEAPFESASNL